MTNDSCEKFIFREPGLTWNNFRKKVVGKTKIESSRYLFQMQLGNSWSDAKYNINVMWKQN